MRRLFRRPQESIKSSQSKRTIMEHQSDVDLSYLSYKSQTESDKESAVEGDRYDNSERRERKKHQRAWSLESDFRISRVVLSPLVATETDSVVLPHEVWMPVSTSMASFAGSIAKTGMQGLAPSQSFLSNPYSQDERNGDSMPSWPSSILCRPEVAPTVSPVRSQEQSEVHCDTPGSLVSDKATESSCSPPLSYYPLSAVCTPKTYSPVTVDRVVPVDEFGRIIPSMEQGIRESDSRQVRFKDTTTLVSASVIHSLSNRSDTSGVPASMASRDTFGNKLEVIDVEGMENSSDAPVGDSSLAFDICPGTPLLLDTEPLKAETSFKGEQSHVIPPNKDSSPVFCFPALCQAANAMSTSRSLLSLSVAKSEDSPPVVQKLLSPIELIGERILDAPPKVYRQDIHFEPWRSSRHSSLSALYEDPKLKLNLYRQEKSIGGRPRADTEVDLARAHNATPFPNPHASIDLSRKQKETRFDLISTTSPHLDSAINATPSSTQESNASVRSIIDQQRLAMEKLTNAGFWHQKSPIKTQEERRRLDHIDQSFSTSKEELVSKVTLWAWHLSSEAEKVEVDEVRDRLRPSSPDSVDDEEKEEKKKKKMEEGEASKSWEWLASEEEFLHDSFESNETIQEEDVQEKKVSARTKVGLGLQQKMPVEVVLDGRDEAVLATAATSQDQDSPVIETPELGQRESRTTAAIEALLTQIQKSQDPPPTLTRKVMPTRKVGTSYLYQQILKNIAEETGKEDE